MMYVGSRACVYVSRMIGGEGLEVEGEVLGIEVVRVV